MTHDIEEHAEELTGVTPAIKTAQPRVKQNTYILSMGKKSQ